MRVVVEKFVEERGLYPSQNDKIKLSEVLGKLFNQQPQEFYDKSSSSQGYITYSLQRYRLNIPPSIRNRQRWNTENTDVDSQFG